MSEIKEIAAEPFKWYKYTGKVCTLKSKLIENRKPEVYELDFKKGYVQGLAPSLPENVKYGEYTFVDVDAPHIAYYINKADAEKIILNSVKVHPNLKRTITDAQIQKEKDDPLAYHWHTFTGLKGQSVIPKGQTAKAGILRPKDVFGLLIYKMDTKGAYLLPSSTISDQAFGTAPIRIDGEQLAKLLGKVTPLDELPEEFRPKEAAPKVPKSKPIVNNTAITSEKNNLEAYEWYTYKGNRGTSVFPKNGSIKAGMLKSGDVFGVLKYIDESTGGYFIADAGVSDPSFKTKPIIIDGDTLANLLAKSDRRNTKPSEAIKPEPKPVPVPTQEPKNGIPSVADLKALHEKVGTIISDLKQIAALPIRTLAEYQLAATKMENIKEKDYESVKQFMHTVGVPKAMADILITSMAGNYHSSVAIIKAKKKAAKGDDVNTPDTTETLEPITPEVEETIEQTSPAHLKAKLLKGINAKGREITVASSFEEVQELIQQLKAVYGTAKSEIQRALPGSANKTKVRTYLAEFKGAYEKAKDIMEAKLSLFNKPEEENVDWDDDKATTPSEDFTPVDELDSEVVNDEDKPTSAKDEDELDSEVVNDEDKPTSAKDEEELNSLLNDEPIAEPSTEKVGVVEQSIVSDIDSITSKIQKRLTRARNINDITKTRDALEKSEEETNDVITSTYGIAHPKRKQYLDDLGAAVDLANDLIDQALAQIEKPKSKNVETKPINTGPAVTQKPPFDEDAPTSAEDAQELEDLLGEDDAPNIDENPNSDYVDEPGDLEGFTSGFDPDDFDDFGFSHDLGAADMVPDHD